MRKATAWQAVDLPVDECYSRQTFFGQKPKRFYIIICNYIIMVKQL